MCKIFIVFLFGISCVWGSITVMPQNAAVIRGEKMYLECRTTDGSTVREWSYKSPDNLMETIIVSNWNADSREINKPRFGLDADEYGSGILYSNDTQLEDGGTYICSVYVGDKIVKILAELIVLESEPVCSVTAYYGSVIQIECSIGFSGHWAPKMEWRYHNTGTAFEDGTLFMSGINNYINSSRVISTLNALLLYSKKDSFTVSCKIYFERLDEFSSGSATNVPDFVRIWRSPVLGARNSGSNVISERPRSFNVVTGVSSDESTSDNSRTTSVVPQKFEYTNLALGGGCLLFVLLLVLVGTTAYIIQKRRKKKKKTALRKKMAAKIGEMKTYEGSRSNVYDYIDTIKESGYEIPNDQFVHEEPGIEVLYPGPVIPGRFSKATDRQDEAEDNSSSYLQIIEDNENKMDSSSMKSSDEKSKESPTEATSYTPLVF